MRWARSRTLVRRMRCCRLCTTPNGACGITRRGRSANCAIRRWRRRSPSCCKTPGPEVKRALTARLAAEPDAPVRTAIERLLKEAHPAAEPAAWWSFDDQNPQTARDVTGRGSDAEIRRCMPVPGKFGTALKFGEGSCVSLGRVPKLPMASQPLTDSFNGIIDEVKVFLTALREEEIAEQCGKK